MKNFIFNLVNASVAAVQNEKVIGAEELMLFCGLCHIDIYWWYLVWITLGGLVHG